MVRKPILTKSSKTVNKKLVKRRLSSNQRAFALLFGIPLIVFAFIALLSYIPQYMAEQADRDKFAKIETLVNSIKVDLEKTYPDKQWEIVKYCQATRGTLAYIMALSCTYGVKGMAGVVDIQELNAVVGERLGEGREITVFSTPYYGYKTNIIDTACTVDPEGDVMNGPSFSCAATTESFVYPEIPR